MSFLVFYFFLVLASLKLVVPVPCGVLDIVYLCIKYNQNIMKSLQMNQKKKKKLNPRMRIAFFDLNVQSNSS